MDEYLNGFSDALDLVQHSITNLKNAAEIKKMINRIAAVAKEGKIGKLREKLFLF